MNAFETPRFFQARWGRTYHGEAWETRLQVCVEFCSCVRAMDLFRATLPEGDKPELWALFALCGATLFALCSVPFTRCDTGGESWAAFGARLNEVERVAGAVEPQRAKLCSVRPPQVCAAVHRRLNNAWW